MATPSGEAKHHTCDSISTIWNVEFARKDRRLSGLSKARSAVQGQGGRAVGRRPQAETAQPALVRPPEDGLEKGAPDAVPSPLGCDPHPADPTRLAPFPIEESIDRAHHVFAFTGEEHHVTARIGDGAGEILPVGRGPRRRVGERIREGIRGVAQGPQADIAVEIHLVGLQPSKVHTLHRGDSTLRAAADRQRQGPHDASSQTASGHVSLGDVGLARDREHARR